jgi:muconolactone delta-isomerase
MKSHTSNIAYEREWARRRELQNTVLVHLTESGSAKWGALYSRFDNDGTGEIGEVLSQLAYWKHIMVESDGTAKITESGMRQLETGKNSPNA